MMFHCSIVGTFGIFYSFTWCGVLCVCASAHPKYNVVLVVVAVDYWSIGMNVLPAYDTHTHSVLFVSNNKMKKKINILIARKESKIWTIFDGFVFGTAHGPYSNLIENGFRSFVSSTFDLFNWLLFRRHSSILVNWIIGIVRAAPDR